MEPALDGTTGRGASLALLRQCLTFAPPAFLEGALRNPDLGSAEILLLLRNRKTPASLLNEIGRNRNWTRFSQVKRRLVLHPRTPLDLSRSLLGHLFWKELAEISAAPHANPIVRRLAGKRLEGCVDRLPLGEQVSLARRATSSLIECLSESGEESVLAALLGNPHLVEADVEKIASGATAPPGLLARMVRHQRWGIRRSIRLALASNPRSPVALALGILRKLRPGDLRRLCDDPEVPKIVRMCAERRVAAA